MKKTLLLIMLVGVCSASDIYTNQYGWVFDRDNMFSYEYRMSPLPMQAGICDIIGVGTVSAITNTLQGRDAVEINVSNYWYGNPGSNILHIVSDRNAPVVTNTPIVFFASSYHLPHGTGLFWQEKVGFSAIFRGNELRQRSRPNTVAVLLRDDRSWFYHTPENAGLISYASNLVTVTQISTNAWKFYEIIRDGYRLNPPDSRIHIDSEMTLYHGRYWMRPLGTNFMWQVWNDPLRPKGEISSFINNAYHWATGVSFPHPWP